MTTPLIQVALDVTSIEAATELAEVALAAGADWLELGKPLIEFEGILRATTLRDRFADAYLVMDLMIIAGARRYVRAAADAGIDNVTVTALAPPETVAETITLGKQHGVAITVDMFNLPSLVEDCVRYETLGADYLMVHFGADQKRRRPDGSPIADLRAVVERVGIPVSYATYDAAESVAAVRAGAAVIVQGEPVTSATEPNTALSEFIRTTKAAGRKVSQQS